MKHFTLIPLYKKNKYIDTYTYWWKQYIAPLDNEIWALIDFIKQYNPNYLLFNQVENSAPPYFSKTELIDMEVIQEYSVNESKKVLIVFAPKLLLHTGLINQFAAEYNDNVFLLWDAEKWDAVLDGDISWNDLERHLVLWPEAEIIISNAKNFQPNDQTIIFNDYTRPERCNPNNYFIGRLAAGNSYYVPSRGNPLTFTYISNAEEKYGNILHFNLYFPRFSFQQPWEGNRTFQSLFDKKTFPIKSKNAVWTGLEQLNHDFLLGNELVITDTFSKQSFQGAEVAKMKNPYYSINIQNGLTPFENNIIIDIW